MDNHIFTVILDWLAFTVPQATIDEIGELLGGEWFEAATGFRGYPICWMTNHSRHGVVCCGNYFCWKCRATEIIRASRRNSAPNLW